MNEYYGGDDRMNEAFQAELGRFNDLIREYGGVDSYSTTQAVAIIEQIFAMTRELGLDPEKREDFFEGLCQIFHIQFINKKDYTHGKYLFVPNHISEFDGLIFGTIVPNVLVVAKSDWVSDPDLNRFIDKLFAITGVVRKDNSSGMKVLRQCIEHVSGAQDGAVTIFVQQTIADLDITTPEDIAIGAFHIAKKAGAQIIPVYSEQASTEAPTRIVFGDPILCEDKNDFGSLWLKSELEMRDAITDPAAREPKLCEKHQKPISQRSF
jgi:hypothetical protein